jgi:hypothetical protein
VYDGNALYWGDLVQNPVNIEVSNENTNSDLTPDIDYVVDWEAQTITPVPSGGIIIGDIISITAYEMGGGNQLFRGNYGGSDTGNSVIIPVNASEIYELVLFVNGIDVSGATWAPYAYSVPWTYENSYAAQTVVLNNGLYYRALQTIPVGTGIDNPLFWVEFIPTLQSIVTFPYPIANVKYATTTSLFGSFGYVYDNGVNGVGATLTSYNVYDDYSALTIDGVEPSVGDRILVKNETGVYVNDTTQSAAFNGIYTVTRVGNSSVYWILTRATDFDAPSDISSAITLVTAGTTNTATRWVCTSNPAISVGTTEIDWTRFIGNEAPYGPGDGISITAMGVEDPQHSWSTAVTQYHTATQSDVLTNSINLENSMQGTNVANLVVTVNGKRLQPPEGIEWTGDGTSSSFGLPQRGNYPQSSINAIANIQVWLNNVLQVQNYGATVGDYYVTNYDGSNTPGRQVVFFTPPADGAQILISVSTIAQYTVVIGSPNRLLITPLLNLGDQIAITSWNDTSQQDPLTLVFVGPVTTGLTLVEPYDSTLYDPLFIDDIISGTSTAGTFVFGTTYTILTAGTTDFIAIGAADNNPGTVFVATGVGSGTGTACPITSTYPSGQFIVGNSYTILTAGTTNFVALGAANNNLGTVFVATGSGTVAANGLVSGRSYTIRYLGDTDWTLLGAASNTFNVTFTANATGTGLGTRTAVQGNGTASGTITLRNDTTNNYNNTSGSFDFSLGISIPDNDFDLGREGLSANRLWVTLNGDRLYPGVDYAVQGQNLILGSGVIGQTQVLAVTEFTQSIVPAAMAFRLFQDMREVQTTFRITTATTTIVAQEVSATADIIYVANASVLSEPNLSAGIFGVATINGERILYRVRDLATNSISGLQRGTAGTAATSHLVNAEVYDMGIGNRQPQQDQNYIVSDTSTGDGSTTIFYASSLNAADVDITINAGNFVVGRTYTIVTVGTTNFKAIGASSNTVGVVFVATGAGSGSGTASTNYGGIEVYVGGNRARVGYYAGQFVIGQTYTIASVGNTNWHAVGLPSDVYPLPGVVFIATGVGSGTGIAGDSLASNYYQETNNNPLTIQFITANDLPAPGAGVEIVILQRRGVTWYDPGNGTPSNGEPLQITDTTAARFLRGL